MRLRSVALLIAGVLVLAMLSAIQYYRAAARRERLDRLNVAAAADATHHFLRGQLRIATRLIVQKPLPHGATATVTIRAPAPPPVIKTDTLRVADTLRARLDTNGIHVAATVAIVPPAVTWRWDLQHDAIAYRATLSCKDHAAQLTVEGPRWQALQLTELQQTPEICNPAPRWNPFSFRPPSAIWIVAIAGAVYVLVR